MRLIHWASKGVHRIPGFVFAIINSILIATIVISAGGGAILSKIQIGDVSDAYQTLINLCPDIESISKSPWIGPVAIALTLILLFLRLYKTPLLLIEHKSMAYDLADLDHSVKKEYWIKRLVLNQVDTLPNGYPSPESLKQIRDTALKAQKRKPFYSLGYYGIAHIPLIFRLGYIIGDQSSISLFHLPRTHDSSFIELKQGNKPHLTVSASEDNANMESSALLVSLSISLRITAEQINGFKNKMPPMHILNFETSEIGFDVIQDYNDAEVIRNTVLQEIRTRVQKYGISKIHLLLSVPSDFTFFLARAFSPQHEPDLCVYHYSKGKYVWGIDMSASDDEATIILEEH